MVMFRDRSYHGTTMTSTSAQGLSMNRAKFEPLLPGFIKLGAPYCYRCMWGKTYGEDCKMECARQVEQEIAFYGPENVGTMLGETMIGTGGVIPPPPEYWPMVNEICKANDVLVINDEVITGFGRAGTWFGFEQFGSDPDLITLAKGLSSGYLPLGAVGAKDHVFEAFLGDPGKTFMSGATYNGHPLCSAAGIANLEIIEREKLVERCAELGPYLQGGLATLLSTRSSATCGAWAWWPASSSSRTKARASGSRPRRASPPRSATRPSSAASSCASWAAATCSRSRRRSSSARSRSTPLSASSTRASPSSSSSSATNRRRRVSERGSEGAPLTQPQGARNMASKPRVGVVGYGVIGQRLADGVALQEDMELVGVLDVAPTLSTRALHESGMPYDLYVAEAAQKAAFEAIGIPVSGTMDDLLDKVDIVLDSSPGGVGRRNKELYKAKGVKAIFQGGEKNDIVDVFFHGYANYEKGLGKDYLKLTSCNTTGLIRAVDCLDREVGVTRVIVTIVRRVADPGDTHRGLVDVAQVEPVPNHQALDLMTIMPHIEATGLLVHVPTTHGHIINVIATTKADVSKERALEIFEAAPAHPRRQDRRRLRLERGPLPLRPRPRPQARRHVRHRGVRRDHRQERPRVHVRHQHPPGSGGDPRDHRRHPRRALPAERPAGGRGADEQVPRASPDGGTR